MLQKYLKTHPWKIVEEGWNPARQTSSESIFALGNGQMGQRANFEETYSGEHLQGSYIAGVYYPDKTRVGWWKNGYPEYFAKVINSVNWIGIDLTINGETLDLHHCKVSDFYRELNMKEGYLQRRFKAEQPSGKITEVEVKRFLSMERTEVGAIAYAFKPLNYSGKIEITPYLDFDVKNSDSNYDEKFWEPVEQNAAAQKAVVVAQTKKLDFRVAAAMRYEIYKNNEHLPLYPEVEKRPQYANNRFTITVEANQEYCLYKYAAVVCNRNYKNAELAAAADRQASSAMRSGFNALLQEQKENWAQRWQQSDIGIEGDPEAQQGIRFNIFQLTQTYTGEDARLNIGPKGFTGEKYGGSTYWDTEAYCLPFYMASAGKEVARNLLYYRYQQLDKAIENAQKLGFDKGAALYPMVTMNGEECHNEWEITFEEIHRNGAIAYAIYNYTRYFNDNSYLLNEGLEVLIAISRFWAQRFNWSEEKQQYVMLGVTGPNEYENNVNNNWYTNYIAKWCLQYTLKTAAHKEAEAVTRKVKFTEREKEHWQKIVENIYFPYSEKHQVYLQQEGYLDKVQRTADDLSQDERPINQHWSWDRILRSCYIKQADTLQGFYFFEDHFSTEELERHFDFYEPRTLHESSLSPCVHVVLAAALQRMDKAYELYHRTSRLDLDDYNREVSEGLHITSMAGTWLSVVEGFGGMRIVNNELHFTPRLPAGWKKLTFKIHFRGTVLRLIFSNSESHIEKVSGAPLKVWVNGEARSLS